MQTKPKRFLYFLTAIYLAISCATLPNARGRRNPSAGYGGHRCRFRHSPC